MAERPFLVGDVVEVDTVLGDVISIDLLSVKLRTFDNLLVRIPNETMVKARLTNYTHHPIRRVEIPFSVAYSSDLPKVKAVLEEVAYHHPHAFDEPEPVILFQAFGASSIDGVFRVWCQRAQVLQVRSELVVRIKQAFDAAGIEIPFPQQVVHHMGAPPLRESPAGA
ncbi:MAG: mechanosensitive ion channel family protein [Myxococcales bacterium]|nr:mechanosensitive ion channel family protein [Myxococcales bacterium]